MEESGMKDELLGKLFSGVFQPKNVYAVYGTPNVGKTVLAETTVASLASQGIRTLWVDTEGGLDFEGGPGIWEAWRSKLETRFGLKSLNDSVQYQRSLDYEGLMAWLGRKVEVDYGEGKIKVRLGNRLKGREAEETVYGKGGFGLKRDNCFIVVDSLSSIFRLEFGSTLENFPGRADAEAYLINELVRLMDRVNAPLLITNHASVNPTNPWVMAQMRGGSTVGYYSKKVCYLEKPKKEVLDTYRKAWAMRSPNAKEWGANCWMKIDGDKGFVSSSEEEVAAILEAAKKGSTTLMSR
jgi:hypothetical protein